MGKDRSLLSRQLSTPSNWTIDTVVKMLFAINGTLVVLATMDADLSHDPADLVRLTRARTAAIAR